MDSFKKKKILKLSILVNGLSLILIFILVGVFRDESNTYLSFGPNNNLFLLSVAINTWERYTVVSLMLAFLSVVDVFVNEFASPIFGFNVYNPDKQVITEFTKNELQLMANIQFFINAIRSVFAVVISVSQFDLIFISVLAQQLATIFTIRFLLNQKKFETQKSVNDILLNEWK